MRKTAVYLACGAAAMLAGSAQASSYSFRLLYSFCTAQSCVDGEAPSGNVVVDDKGNVFGTTEGGGASGAGTVFEVTAGGKEIVRHAFARQSDGGFPVGGLTADGSGDLFGTTQTGGVNGGGTIFEVPKKGGLKTIDSLQFSQAPLAALVISSSGVIFGTSSQGGANGGGAVFEVTKKGQEQTIYSFCAHTQCADGKTPQSSLVLSKSGKLYGTASAGGGAGQGVVFEVSETGQYKILCNFLANAKCTAGAAPLAGLVMTKKGEIYGTTSGGGDHNEGTVFALTSQGKQTILHSFCATSGCLDGFEPEAPLALDPKGTLYGTTVRGGQRQSGTAFSITAKGKLTTIYNFCEASNCADGSGPGSGLTIDKSGNLYGVTRQGGEHGGGTLFELVKQ